jgi:hypothetical protein
VQILPEGVDRSVVLTFLRGIIAFVGINPETYRLARVSSAMMRAREVLTLRELRIPVYLECI